MNKRSNGGADTAEEPVHHNVEGRPKCKTLDYEIMTTKVADVTCRKCVLVKGQVRLTSITLKRALRLCLHETGGDLCTRRAGHEGGHIDLEVGIGWLRSPNDDCAPVDVGSKLDA